MPRKLTSSQGNKDYRIMRTEEGEKYYVTQRLQIGNVQAWSGPQIVFISLTFVSNAFRKGKPIFHPPCYPPLSSPDHWAHSRIYITCLASKCILLCDPVFPVRKCENHEVNDLFKGTDGQCVWYVVLLTDILILHLSPFHFIHGYISLRD